MLINDLQSAMREAAETQPFTPDLSRVSRRSQQLRRHRLVAAAAGTAFAAALAAVVTVTVTSAENSPNHVATATPDPAIAATVAAVAHWGGTRGSLASDSAFLDRVRQEWLHPQPGYYGDLSKTRAVTTSADGTRTDVTDSSRHLVAQPKILYAGRAGGGEAAVVAQRSGNPDAGIYLGFLLQEAGRLRLVSQLTPTWYPWAATDGTGSGFDSRLITFRVGPSGESAVILPADATNEISISRRHTVTPSGQIRRTWNPLHATSGVATVTASGPAGFADTLIRLRHDGTTIDRSQIRDVRGGIPDESVSTTTTAPPNELILPLSFQYIGGSVPGGGVPKGYNAAWANRYAKPEEPFGVQQWSAGSPQPTTVIIVEQAWFAGDPAHTVVLRIVDGRDVQIVSDIVTDPLSRPLVFLRLPDDNVWLVLGGPGTTVKSYRPQGESTWTDVETGTASTENGKAVTTREASFIHSPAKHIQVRLEVDGKTKIVSK